MIKNSNDNLRRTIAGFLVGTILGNSVTIFVNKNHSSVDGLGQNSNCYCNSNLVDCFDYNCRLDIGENYYVLKLREAYETYCNEYPQYKTIDVELVPKYLLLKGVSLKNDKYSLESAILYDFINWNDDINNRDNYTTNVSLLRCAKDKFDIIIWFSRELEDGLVICKLTDSYMRDISCLSNFEKHEIAEQYEYNKDVISILNGGQIMSNGFTKEENIEILKATDLAKFKSRTLRKFN